MDFSWIWQTALIYFIGTLILRIGGRKTISQMTISESIIMIALGTLLIQPITGRGLIITFLAGLWFTILMVITEYLQVKIDLLEKFFSGRSIIVIENGKLNINNLRKLRLSVDILETRLRQAGISSIDDVKYATIEVSGQLGYELKENKKPVTKEDLSFLMNQIEQIKKMSDCNMKNQNDKNNVNNIFEEIKNEKYEGDKNEP